MPTFEKVLLVVMVIIRDTTATFEAALLVVMVIMCLFRALRP
jgi:hypothetical protein